MAATRSNDHVAIFLQNNVGVIVKVQDRDGGQLGRRAARLWDRQRLHEVSKCLNYGVVGGIHLGVQRERTLAIAVESSVAFRRYDPILQRTLNRFQLKRFRSLMNHIDRPISPMCV